MAVGPIRYRQQHHKPRGHPEGQERRGKTYLEFVIGWINVQSEAFRALENIEKQELLCPV
jgi:hypothetical protein